MGHDHLTGAFVGRSVIIDESKNADKAKPTKIFLQMQHIWTTVGYDAIIMALYGTVLKVSSMALFTPGINMSFGQPLGPCNSVLRAKAYTRKQGIGPRGELGLSLREFTISRNCLVTDISHKCQKIGWMDLKTVKLNCLTLGEW